MRYVSRRIRSTVLIMVSEVGSVVLNQSSVTKCLTEKKEYFRTVKKQKKQSMVSMEVDSGEVIYAEKRQVNTDMQSQWRMTYTP